MPNSTPFLSDVGLSFSSMELYKLGQKNTALLSSPEKFASRLASGYHSHMMVSPNPFKHPGVVVGNTRKLCREVLVPSRAAT